MWKFILQIIRVLFEPGSQNIDPEPSPAPIPAPEPPKPSKTGPEMLYEYSLTLLGKDASPADKAPDYLACAETVCNIINGCFGDFPMEGGTIISTTVLYKKLKYHSKFQLVPLGEMAIPGDIIISPTGYGNGTLPNGHTGIVGKNDTIMSNDSSTGNFESNYTLNSWYKRYGKLGGFPIYVFRRLSP